MHVSEAPKFLKQKPEKKARRKQAKPANLQRGDTGTPESKARALEADLAAMTPAERKAWFSDKRGMMQAGVAKEVRARSSTGHETMSGVRVVSQFPLDRYKARNQLDPDDAWRNMMLWESAERLRRDFDQSGLGTKTCSSFVPRISGGNGQWESDIRVAALGRYKKAMNAIGLSLRSAMYWICISGESANAWAARNAMVPQAGLSILRLGLAELAHHYGLIKMQIEHRHSGE